MTITENNLLLQKPHSPYLLGLIIWPRYEIKQSFNASKVKGTQNIVGRKK